MTGTAQRFALVTGASRGIGREIALRLADMADGVAVHYHRQRPSAENVVHRIMRKGKRSAAFPADLTRESQASGLIRKVENKFGRIDILVNNFGPFRIKPWEKLTAADWDSVLKGNLESAFFCMKAVLPGMRKRKWGRIINIGYGRAEQIAALPNITPYAVAKTGLLILTRTAALTEMPSGITVNMVSPGLIKGGILPSGHEVSQKDLGMFKDVAEAVAFLAAEEAKAISGTNLIVAGTWKM
ncbi:MAG: SDR family oxidoreductase [Candidatus Aminicenantales bacterium]